MQHDRLSNCAAAKVVWRHRLAGSGHAASSSLYLCLSPNFPDQLSGNFSEGALSVEVHPEAWASTTADPILQLANASNIRETFDAIALRCLTAWRGLITGRWHAMPPTPALADAAQQLARVSPSLARPQTTIRSRQCLTAIASAAQYQFSRNSQPPKAAALLVIAAAGGHSTAAAVPESMTKYGSEQEAACRAVRLAAKLCQACATCQPCSHCTPAARRVPPLRPMCFLARPTRSEPAWACSGM